MRKADDEECLDKGFIISEAACDPQGYCWAAVTLFDSILIGICAPDVCHSATPFRSKANPFFLALSANLSRTGELLRLFEFSSHSSLGKFVQAACAHSLGRLCV